MTTFNFTASCLIATEFMLRVLNGKWQGGKLQGPPSWASRVPFFSKITATPIKTSAHPASYRLLGATWTKVKREVSFYRFGLLFATITLSGSKYGNELDNESSWRVTKIRCAMTWVGSLEDLEPKDWIEIEVQGEPSKISVL